MPILPTTFLFRYAFPVPQVNRIPRAKRPFIQFPATATLPRVSMLDQSVPFGTIQAGWNANGLGFIVTVSGREERPSADPDDPTNSDGVWFWIDTRDTQSVHRATRFCHCFCACPTGDGPKSRDPFVQQHPIHRAGEDAPSVDPSELLIESEVTDSGYEVRLWFPKTCLYGFDPAAQNRLGFYCLIRDLELGNQFLTCGSEFPVTSDPSQWASLELVRN